MAVVRWFAGPGRPFRPRPQTERDVTTATDMALPVLGGLRVLVVDADPDEAASLTAVLRLYGFDARSAGSAAGAVSLVRSFAPNVLVTDLRLPDAVGADVVARLRAAGCPPVLVVTGLTDPRQHAAVRASGAADVLLKPAEPADLARAIHRYAGPATRTG
jgi:DNA-binding response OmpR family regulator